MKGLLLILFISFSGFSSENQKLQVLKTGSSDLRFGRVLIKINSLTNNDEVVFIENNDNVAVLKNKRTLKFSQTKVKQLDELFVKNFIKFKYESPRNLDNSCQKIYTLFLRGDDTVICKDESSKIVKIQQYIEQLNRL